VWRWRSSITRGGTPLDALAVSLECLCPPVLSLFLQSWFVAFFETLGVCVHLVCEGACSLAAAYC
jgi:hypothetical protein